MTDKQEKMLARIKALQLKTVENGASEAEAMAAAAKAAELLTQYGLSQTQVDIETSAYVETVSDIGVPPSRVLPHAVVFVTAAISRLTDTRGWITGGRYGFQSKSHHFGQPQDAEMAHYLVDLCRNAIDSDWEAFKAKGKRERFYTHKKSFHEAMAGRLSMRIDQMAGTKESDLLANEGSKALVPVKRAAVDSAFEERGIKLVKSKPREPKDRFAPSSRAGWEAGGKVELTRPIGSSA